MTVNVFGGGYNPLAPVFPVQRSVRLRSSVSGYFNRTFTTPTDNKKWTMSMWLKRGSLGGNINIFGSVLTGGYFEFRFNTSDQIYIQNRVSSTNLLVANTTAVFRDPSAWYHIVFVFDSANATAANRNLLYVNNVNVTLSANSGSGDACAFNSSGNTQYIGNSDAFTTFDGYLTEVNFIDGQALTPSSFGSYNAGSGVWQPIRYSGTYGTNGFYLNFQDNSAATAAAIGKDSSGNGNNWTPNNISVTAGVTYDSMLDVPTLTSATNANFSVINPLDVQNASSVAQGNQYISFSAVNYGHSRATQAIPDGSYWEVVSGGSNWLMLGVANSTAYSSFNWAGSWAIYQADGRVYNNGAAITGVLATFTTNDVIGFAVKGNKLYIAKNGVWLNSGDPVAQTGFVASGISSEVFPYIGNGGGAAGTPSAYFNAGQRPFTYTPPTGYKTINTYNLATPTIPNGATQFAATTYTGNGGTQSITNTVNGKSFQPDLVWVKARSVAYNNYLEDSVRGVGKDLSSNLTDAEATYNLLTSFNSNGFTVFTNGTYLASNQNGTTYVGWQWKASNAAAVTNTSGSITSSVSANPTAGFSILTYTGTGANATVGHGLGVAPKMIIVKVRSTTNDWVVYHSSIGNTGAVFLDLTNATSTSINYWNNTSPTSTAFTIGIAAGVNNSTSTFVAYCFSEIAGYSKFGSYTGNASTNGPFIYTGMRPRWIMIKRTDAAGYGWNIYDTSRSPYNIAQIFLQANASNAETNNAAYAFDLLSNGFKLRQTDALINASGGTYIYAAFAENPFSYSLAR